MSDQDERHALPIPSYESTMDSRIHRDEMLRLAERHQPRDFWTNGGELLAVSCEVCGQVWPCATNLALLQARRDEPF